jgi:hypothetical protein
MTSGLISMRFEVLMAVSACIGVYARLTMSLQHVGFVIGSQ